MAKKTFAQIAKIKNIAARAKADQALDKAKGIKQGSAKDKAIDTKVTKVAKYEYGSKGKYAGKKY
jgi:hypothetical protein